MDYKLKGRAVSMTRLDLLAQPTRRNGEHIRAVIERQKQQSDIMSNSFSHQHPSNTTTTTTTTNKTRSMSRSLTHLAGNPSTASIASQKKHLGSTFRPLSKTNSTKSMTQLSKSATSSRTNTFTKSKHHHKNTATTAAAGGDHSPATSNLSGGTGVC